MSYELVDQRGPRPRLVWRDTVSGFAVGDPAAPKYAPLPGVVQGAGRDLLTRLARELQVAMERLRQAEAKAAPPPVPVAPGFAFLVQRATRTRAAVEFVTVQYPTGRIISFRTEPASSLPPGKPGDWLLSRQIPSGELILGDRYEELARKLASHFDLRRVDDAYHYRFFGLRGKAAAWPPRLPALAEAR